MVPALYRFRDGHYELELTDMSDVSIGVRRTYVFVSTRAPLLKIYRVMGVFISIKEVPVPEGRTKKSVQIKGICRAFPDGTLDSSQPGTVYYKKRDWGIKAITVTYDNSRGVWVSEPRRI